MESRPNSNAGSHPASTPCIHVCEMDPATHLCQGCHRTQEEICAWPGGGSVFGGAILPK